MENSPYQLMQKAVDIVGTSPHPANKIAATVAGGDFSLARVNYWPEAIEKAFGRETRIGNSSGTIHAETACILAAPRTEGASMFATDPPCPNCAKNMAEAGIKALYIDHKGFDKDWAARSGHHFEHMAMQIFERAGVSVFKIHRKEQKIEPILEIPQDFKPALEKPIRADLLQNEKFGDMVAAAHEHYGSEAFALAFARDKTGGHHCLSGEAHPTIGYTSRTLDTPEGKYSFMLEPVNRLIMEAAQRGLKIENGMLYSSRVPTSRELVNMVGAGLTKIQIGNTDDSRDEHGPKALKQLQDAKVLTISHN